MSSALPKSFPVDSPIEEAHGSRTQVGKHQNYAMTPSEPSVVIPCPSCDTKFAVESSLIAAVETPKFHCSRCDAVFGMPSNLAKHRDGQLDGGGATKTGRIQTTESIQNQDIGLSIDDRSQLGIKPSDFSLAARGQEGAPQGFVARTQAPAQPGVEPSPPPTAASSNNYSQGRAVLPGDAYGRLSEKLPKEEQPSAVTETPSPKRRYDIEELLAHSARSRGDT